MLCGISCLFELIKLADNQDRHELSDEFEIWLKYIIVHFSFKLLALSA